MACDHCNQEKVIEELKRRVEALEARPKVEEHHHYHNENPVFGTPVTPVWKWVPPQSYEYISGHRVGLSLTGLAVRDDGNLIPISTSGNLPVSPQPHRTMTLENGQRVCPDC